MAEIYNETMYNLPASNELKIKNEIGEGASIVGLVEEPTDILEKGLDLQEKKTNLRSIETTTLNNSSSHSHASFSDCDAHRNHESCLKLVGLAGTQDVATVLCAVH